MIPVMQTLFPGDSPIHGNCLQAAVASIVELPLASVPHFVQLAEDTDIDWYILLKEWLININLRILPMCLDARYTDEYYLVTGPSPRGNGFHHAVVYQNGRMAHDPHPDSTGILGVANLYSIRNC